jgi:hypothetical protein
MTYDDVLAYASKIGIAFTRGDVEQILEWAREDNETDVRYPVWEFLDTYEGISHARDPEWFADEYLDDDND